MSIQQAVQAVQGAFPNISVPTTHGSFPLWVVMVAISGAETGGTWNPTAGGDCGLGGPSCGPCLFGGTGATSWGLWQIHNVHATYLTTQTHSADPCVWRQWLEDPDHNAQAAASVWRSQGLAAWTTYLDGHWATFIPAARQALATARPTSTSTPTPTVTAGWMLLGLGVITGFAVWGNREEGGRPAAWVRRQEQTLARDLRQDWQRWHPR